MTPNGIESICCFASHIPSLEYDSWVTIGLDQGSRILAGGRRAGCDSFRSAGAPVVQRNSIREEALAGASMVIDDICGGRSVVRAQWGYEWYRWLGVDKRVLIWRR